jgi:hypothetical protein
MTAEQFMDLPAPRWLVPGTIPDAGFGVLVGPPRSGKSVFALHLALAVATDRALLQQAGLEPTRAGWVEIMLGESRASWGARLRAAVDFLDVTLAGRVHITTRPPALGDPVAFGAYARGLDRESAQRGGRPALVIVDTLSACAPGSDENSASEMGVVVGHLQQLVAGGSCVIALHHPGKSGSVYRGSSALLGSCDFLLRLDRDGRTRTLTSEKLRDADGIDSLSFELVPHAGAVVARATEAPTATWLFSTAEPNLRAALHGAGYRLPGDPENEAALQAAGVTLRALLDAWGVLAPITPTRAENRKANDAERYRRQDALLGLARRLVTAGALRVKSGVIGGTRTDSMQAVIVQVSNA